MRIYIVTTFIGCFGATESGKVVSFKPFPKNVEKITEKLKSFELIEEEKEMMKESMKEGYKEIIFSTKKEGVNFVEPNNRIEKYIKDNLRKLAIEHKFVKDQMEFNQLFSRINIELTKTKIKKSIERDNLIIQTNNSIEEIDKSLNIFIERLKEFYGLYFPEIFRIVSDRESFSQLVEKYGFREKIPDPEIKHFAGKSMGMNFEENDVKTTQLFATEINRLFKLRENLSKYLEKNLKELAPNLAEIAGPSLAAKLISKSGSLEKLARMASSTIQLLGSERALFRHLHNKEKTLSPKYGYIAMHTVIQNSPQEFKGKLARLLASKISIAAKMDFYSKEYKAIQLKKDLQEKAKKILSSK
jgi:nucleolar protein 56